MPVNVSTNQELKDKILKVVNLVGNTVGSTLGPGGRPVLVSDEDGTIRVTKDGVSVSKAMTSFSDPVEDKILQLIKTTSQKSVDTVGDGTTTAMVLTQAFIVEGLKAINAGSNVVEVQRGIQKSTLKVIETLKSFALDINSEEQIKDVAKLSANGDQDIANLIANALDFAKEDGVVVIEESKTGEHFLEFVEGMYFERGMVSPYFITDETKGQTVFKNPAVMLVDGTLHSNKQLAVVLNKIAKTSTCLLVFADAFEGEALSTLIVNKMQGTIQVVAVKSPDFGDRRLAILEDIAIMTGGQVISKKKGIKIEELTASGWDEYLGKCRTITVTAKDTTIVDGLYKMTEEQDGFEEDEVTPRYISAIEKRLLELKAQLDNPKTSLFDRQNLQERISKLTGGVAIINVGGKSEVEMRERKDRVDDALHATKAALLEGIVPGGGLALINCIPSLKEFVLDNKDQEVGKNIVVEALYAPFIKILSNAGIEDYLSIKGKIGDEPWAGYNLKNGEYGDMRTMGVVDPVKVTRTALENASSVASTLLTTTAAVYEVFEEKSLTKQEVLDTI